jgi:endonuclease/exonuclease/phosphatase (EEP) superfamily protein YafD
MAEKESGPVLMMGDFNTTDMDENYSRLTTNFADTFREVGWGLGFTNPDWQHNNPRRGPSFMPMYQRIDYVFHNAAFTPVEARVGPSSGGSDHRPLYVVLALSKAP